MSDLWNDCQAATVSYLPKQNKFGHLLPESKTRRYVICFKVCVQAFLALNPGSFAETETTFVSVYAQ